MLAALTGSLSAAQQAAPDDGEPAVGQDAPKVVAKAHTQPGRPHENAARPARKSPLIDFALVRFTHSPFPYNGNIPDQNTPFLGKDADGEFHLAPRAGKLRKETYEDTRSLLSMPPDFDPRRPDAKLVLFFHGNLANLTRDVAARQRVPAQLAASHLNAALVAPQMAKDALDSSAGRFWDPGFLDDYLDEAADHLAQRANGRFDAAAIDRLPVIVVAYSGGYLPTAFSLLYAGQGGGHRHRIEGVVLLDALFGESGKFENWILSAHERAYFVSLYSKASSAPNIALADRLRAAGLPAEERLPPHIGPGTLAFAARLGAVHNDFVTRAGSADPLADALRRIARDATGGPAAADNGARANDSPGNDVPGDDGPAAGPYGLLRGR